MTQPRDIAPIKNIASLVVIGLLAAMVVFTSLPKSTEFMLVLHKTGHPLVFGVTALLVLRLLKKFNGIASRPLWIAYLIAFAMTVLLGAMTEVAQLFTHRNARVADVISDAIGAVACLAGHAAIRGRRQPTITRGTRLALWAIAVAAALAAMAPLMVCMAAYTVRDTKFPVILDNSSRLALYFVSKEAENVSVVPMPGQWLQRNDEPAIRVAIDRGPYPGLHVIEPYPRWSKYRTLAIDITQPGATKLAIVVRVHDRQHNHEYNDRFNREFTIAATTRTIIRVPLNDIQRGPKRRMLDMDAIADLNVFALGPVPKGELLISRIWLE